MKTANIQVYETVMVYIKYCAVCLKIDYTLRCICPVSPLLKPVNREDTDKCTRTIS